MKIAVQSIMLNEPPEFIERWAKGALDADEMVLVDTGSTNDAVECARDLGITVHEIVVRPWRFDVARNAALALLPEDIDLVVKVDVDEVLLPGWRNALEQAPRADRYQYLYIWSHDAAGNPDVQFLADHTITRRNWMWEHPVHESLRWTGEGAPTVEVAPFVIDHLADPNKSRASYLPLLERATAERPDDDRMAHYYARELFFRGDWVAARAEFVRHLSLPTAVWSAERAQSYRYLAKMDDYPERWLLKAVAEAPDRREPWVDLVDHWLAHDQQEQAAGYAARALLIRGGPGDYMSEAHAWDDERLRLIAGM
jgi:glycosyltransferase involved in cell wall biosynthesis